MSVGKRSTITIVGLKGQRVVVRYYDKKIKKWIIEDFIELLRGDLEYSLDLETGEDAYRHDRLVFNAIVASFALTKGEYTQNQ